MDRHFAVPPSPKAGLSAMCCGHLAYRGHQPANREHCQHGAPGFGPISKPCVSNLI